MARRFDTRGRVMIALILCALGSWMLANAALARVAQSNFVGGDPTRPDASDIRALRLRFEPGARSNWHYHGNFQVIMAEEGRGRTQVRGEPMQQMLPGVAHYAGPGVVHWHGAAPDEHMVQLTIASGQTNWLEPVSDEEYLGQ